MQKRKNHKGWSLKVSFLDTRGPWMVPGSWLIIRVDFRQFQSSIFASPLARAPFSIASLSERLDY